MKRFLFLAFALQSAYAQEESVPESYYERLNHLDKITQEHYNQSASLSSGIFFRGDVLYWTARENGMAYALDSPPTLTGAFFEVKELQFDWHFGFRGEVGYNFKRDGWDLGLLWTHLFTRANDRGKPSDGHHLVPIWANPNFQSFLAHSKDAEAKWHLHYDQLDLPLGRAFYVSKYFILRPFMGPSGLSIKQSYSLKYERPPAFFGIIPFGRDKLRWENHYLGVGINTGCDLKFGFRSGWSIYGRAGAGLYYGHFHLKLKDKFDDELGKHAEVHAKHVLHLATPSLATALGFRFDHSYSEGSKYFVMSLLWDNLIFFSQNQFFRFISLSDFDVESNVVTNQGDLGLQGGTFSLTFGF
jgi:hypothetical protein